MDQQNLQSQAISRLTIAGYKSISREQSIEIRPLTILAGTNSSGKSSIIQPLLLLKQTLEATFDPGPLLLNGPNVKFTAADQLLANDSKGKKPRIFQVGFGVEGQPSLTYDFQYQSSKGFELHEMHVSQNGESFTFNTHMNTQEVSYIFNHFFGSNSAIEQNEEVKDAVLPGNTHQVLLEMAVVRDRCLLDIVFRPVDPKIPISGVISFFLVATIRQNLRSLIHLPGLRGNPERTYPVTAVGPAFPGTFEAYVASVIARWQTDKQEDRLAKLGQQLERLGLTWKVAARRINDTQVELQVGRLPRPARGGAHDLVSIADVGVGVSQTLPVLVALLVAEPGQIVYIEQPEIHLHPRAQTALAEILADAARRGVRVVTETHSSLLILGIQTLIAERKLDPTLVKLHWFQRGEEGTTDIVSTDLDDTGAFGDWPIDFADVALEAESRYLDAAESY